VYCIAATGGNPIAVNKYIIYHISNVPGVISRNLLTHTDSSVNFLSPLNALNFTVSISKSLMEIPSSSVSPLEINLSFSKDVTLLLSSRSFRTFVGKIKRILFNDEIEQATWFPLGHTSIPQETVLPILLAGSPPKTRISQQV
jgi:hypothetical protein